MEDMQIPRKLFNMEFLKFFLLIPPASKNINPACMKKIFPAHNKTQATSAGKDGERLE